MPWGRRAPGGPHGHSLPAARGRPPPRAPQRGGEARDKAEIKPMNKASESLLALKPVTFRYKKEVDPEQAPQFGLVAEEVEKVNPDLVARDRAGKPYTVRYDAVNAMLLNEFLKEHRRAAQRAAEICEQKATIANLKSNIAKQQKGMEALAAHVREQDAKIQRVNDQIQLSNSVSRVVAGDQ